MKNLKKFLTIALTLCILSVLSIGVYADAVEINSDSDYQIKISVAPEVADSTITPGSKIVASFSLVDPANEDGVSIYQSSFSSIVGFLYYPEVLTFEKCDVAMDGLTLDDISGTEDGMLFLGAGFSGSGLLTFEPTDVIFTATFTVADDADGDYTFTMGEGDDAGVFELNSAGADAIERGVGAATTIDGGSFTVGNPPVTTYDVTFTGYSAYNATGVTAGSKITLPEAPEVGDNKVFIGWNDGTTTYDAGAEYTVNSNVTFTAVTKTKPSCTSTVEKPGQTITAGDVQYLNVFTGEYTFDPGDYTITKVYVTYGDNKLTLEKGGLNISGESGAKVTFKTAILGVTADDTITSTPGWVVAD